MKSNPEEPKFFKTVIDDFIQFFKDLASGVFFAQVRRDYRELKDFFLDLKLICFYFQLLLVSMNLRCLTDCVL